MFRSITKATVLGLFLSIQVQSASAHSDRARTSAPIPIMLDTKALSLQPSAQTRAVLFMRVYGRALAPYGYVQFCERNMDACRSTSERRNRVAGTPANLSELDAINRMVNRRIIPMTDQAIYGKLEHWTLPGASRKGDCEDYVLLKRRILMRRGWPASALSITVVRDEYGDGHAILTARTSSGDFILDNKTDDIRLWSKTSYKFVMRQSYIDPNVWVSLDSMEATSLLPLAGVRSK